MLGCEAETKCFAAESRTTQYVKTIRRVYTHGLQTSNLRAATPKIHSVLDKVIEIIEEKRQNGPIEFQSLCVRMALDAIGVTALDMELGGLDNSRQICKLLIDAGHICVKRGYNPLQWRLYALLPFLKGAQEENRTLSALAAEWDALTREVLSRPDPPAGEEPLWYALKSLTDPDTGRRLGQAELKAELAVLVLAGMDTTGHQLAFVLALLASSPRVVEKLIEELKEHELYGPEFKRATFEDLGDLAYLSAVVKEGLRVSYISPVITERTVPEDMTILGFRMPKGTTVALPGLRWMSSEADWGDPDVFRPERWLAGEDVSQKYYLPFSVGPRDCVGQKLAVLKLRLAIVRLVQKYRLIPTCPAEELLKNSRDGIVIESMNGVWLHVNPQSADTPHETSSATL